MKIKLWSDIHLEFTNSSVPIERDGADVLVLAGDICVAREMPNYVPFFEKCAEVFPHVIYIAGNHEYYNGSWERTYDIMREDLAHLGNVHVMDGESVQMDGVWFWAGTLWTDCNGGDQKTMEYLADGMNDYRTISTVDGPLRPYDTVKEHLAQRTGLEMFLADHIGDKIVVVTHMAPSKKSTHPRYQGDSLMNGGYSTDLTYLMAAHPSIKLWCHGHTHDSFDYVEHSTRVVANPAGYPLSAFLRNREGRENPTFNPSLVLEV